jgi:hypothetical protein
LMEPTTEVVSSLDFPLPERSDLYRNGVFRWPYALLNRHAWRFTEPRRLFTDFSSRSFAMDSAAGIVALEPDEADSILALPKEEVPLQESIRSLTRVEGEASARRKSSPPPSTKRTGIMQMRRAPAHTYLMELEGGTQKAFKVGWAFEYRMREREFNKVALHELGGIRYRTKLYEFWGTAREAYQMEQAILNAFDQHRHPQNHEVICDVAFEKVWEIWRDQVALRRRR